MQFLPFVAVAVVGTVAVLSAGHALLHKRDPRASLGWIAVCLIFPAFGPLLYWLFGLNRIETKARELARRSPIPQRGSGDRPSPALTAAVQEAPSPELRELLRISAAVTGNPLVHGNRVEALHNGEEAYPAMLDAIGGARRRVFLLTYIFETNAAGLEFVEALASAVSRGVDVRVIVDGVGELYSWPRVSPLLRRQGVRVERFLPPRLLPPSLHVNLRNHRKILVVDGDVGFTGGMNLGSRHLVEAPDNRSPVVDVHFRLQGPVVTEIERSFLSDWQFVTREPIPRPADPPEVPAAGEALCRLVLDGPDENLDRLAMILVGAVSSARRRVDIMTPYFLPAQEMIAALQAAALRGVAVTVILPEKNNLPAVHWATRNMLWQLLQRGVRVFYQPPPFVHSKLFLVDGHYAQIGSANIDPRSLRLNFELAVEVYHRPFTGELQDHIDAVRSASREVSLEEVDGRPLAARLRDGLAWLFTPYL